MADSSMVPTPISRQLAHPSLLNLRQQRGVLNRTKEPVVERGAALGLSPKNEEHKRKHNEDEDYDISMSASQVDPGAIVIEIELPQPTKKKPQARVSRPPVTFKDRVVDRALKLQPIEAVAKLKKNSGLERIYLESAYNEHRPYHHIAFPATIEELRQTGSDRYFIWVRLWIILLSLIGLVGLALTIVSALYLRWKGGAVPFWHWFSVGHIDPSLRIFYIAYVSAGLGLMSFCPVIYMWYLRRLKGAHNVNSLHFDETMVADRHGGAVGSSNRSNALDLLKHEKNDHGDARPAQLRRSQSLPDIVRNQGVDTFAHQTLASPSARAASAAAPASPTAPLHRRMRSHALLQQELAATAKFNQSARGTRCATRYVLYQVLGWLTFGVLLFVQFTINFQIQRLGSQLASVVVAGLLSVNLNVLNLVWHAIANVMTRARGDNILLSDYQNSMAFKTFSFRLCSTVVLISLTRGFLRNGEYSEGCVWDQLSQQYIISLLTDVATSFLTGIVFGWLQRSVMWCLCRKSRSGDNRYNPEFSFVEEYDDIVRKLQLVMFALPATPLFPICMALVLLVEYYIDQYKLLRLCKPIPAMQSKFHRTLTWIVWFNIVMSSFIPNGTFWILRQLYIQDSSLCV